jgi:hypothetical protein
MFHQNLSIISKDIHESSGPLSKRPKNETNENEHVGIWTSPISAIYQMLSESIKALKKYT